MRRPKTTTSRGWRGPGKGLAALSLPLEVVAFWRRTVEDLDQNEGDFEHALHLMEKHNALEDTVERARHYGAIARDALGIFSDRAEKSAFNELIDFCIERVY